MEPDIAHVCRSADAPKGKRFPGLAAPMGPIVGLPSELAAAIAEEKRADAPKPTKPKLVEPSPNARARDAAVKILKEAMARPASWTDVDRDIKAALVCLEEIR